MKLKTRLGAAFLIITIVPMMLFYFLVVALSDYQTKSFSREYGLTRGRWSCFQETLCRYSTGSQSVPRGDAKDAGAQPGEV